MSGLDCAAYGDSPLCAAVNSLVTVTAPALECGVSGYIIDGACANYTSPLEKVAGMLGDEAEVDSGNVAWVLMSAALVMLMTPGLGLFYAGLAGQKIAGNTIMMSFASMCLVSVQWFLFGYSFAFAPGTPGFGDFSWGALKGIGQAPSGVYGGNIPHILFVAFQMMFAMLTPAIISGALVGRMKFTTWCVFVLIWTTIVYDPLAHWVWAGSLDENYEWIPAGYLGELGAIDFAGGTVIHIASGFASIAVALVLGPREDKMERVMPHSNPLVVIGATFLWFGWFGFNAGSAGGADGVAASAFWNTHLATASAAMIWVLLERIHTGNATIAGAAAGAVAGLVGITPACGFVEAWAALVIGLVTSFCCYFCVLLKNKIHYDDTLDAFPLHGMGGIVGAFLTGIFAVDGGVIAGSTDLLAAQCIAIAVAGAYSFGVTLLIALFLKFTMGLRVSPDSEKAGVDVSEHGDTAYQQSESVTMKAL